MAMYQVQMVNNVKTLVPVSGDVSTDNVTDNDMHPVTSNAVADSLSYSTTETLTGGKWIDGKPIYRRVFTGLNYGGTTNAYVDTGARIPNCDTLVSAYSIKGKASVIYLFGFLMDGDIVRYWASNGWGEIDKLVVEYTKTT